MQLQSLTIEFILLQISVAFSPGLIIALVVNEAVQKGRKNALQVAYGAATGAIGITLITAAVISYIFSLIPEILTFIYIFGIIWLGALLGWEKPIFELGAKPFLLAELFKVILLSLLITKFQKIRI